MLIVLIFLMVGLTVAMLMTAPAIATAVKRDKEEEMIHRGVEYARAVKKYYKKFGRYPANIEALENTNNMRFLRKRYKDPFSKDGKWQLVRFGQVQFNAGQRQGGTGFTGSNQPGLPNIPGVTGMLQGQNSQTGQQGSSAPVGGSFGGFGQQNSGNQQPGGNFGQQQNSGNQPVGGTFGQQQSSGNQPVGGSFSQPVSGNQNTQGNLGQPGSGTDQTGGTFGQSTTAGGNQAFGGGAIIGVASTSARESLRLVDDKNHYKDWKFVYDPTFDRGGLITGPYDPKKLIGKFPGASGMGQQIGQPIGGQQQGSGSSFGNNSSFGQPQQSPMQQPYQPPDQVGPPK